MKLGRVTREVLREMIDRFDEEEGELVQSVPGGWWLDNRRVSGKIGWFLLQACLIREVRGGSDDYRVYVVHREEALKALNEPDYIPNGFRIRMGMEPDNG